MRLNGARTKPGKDLKAGDTLTVRRGFTEWTVEVTALAERRGDARAAAELYAETTDSLERRAAEAARRRDEQLGRIAPVVRPTKRDRRRLRELKDVSRRD